MGAVFVFLVGVAAIVLWWLSQQRLLSKPWLEEGAFAELPGTGASLLPPAKIGLGIFLAVVGSLFSLLMSAYVMQMGLAEIKVGEWSPLPAPKLLWFNTGMLIVSSVALHRGKLAARRGQMAGVREALLAGGASALAFVVGQLLVWQQLNAWGYFLAANPANSFFYLITGLHGLHVLGGLVALGKTFAKVWRNSPIAQVRLSVELCAIYWHFLLVVWLVMFGMLTGWADHFVAVCRSLLN